MKHSDIEKIINAKSVRPVFGGMHELRNYLIAIGCFGIFLVLLYDLNQVKAFIESVWLFFLLPPVAFIYSRHRNARIYLIGKSQEESLSLLTDAYVNDGFKLVSDSEKFCLLESQKGSYFPKKVLIFTYAGHLYGASWSKFISKLTHYIIWYSGKNEINKMVALATNKPSKKDALKRTSS